MNAMSYQQPQQRSFETTLRVTQPQYDVECPDKGSYPLQFQGVRKCGEYKKFNSNEMGTRCMMSFVIVDPAGQNEDKGWAGTEVTAWMTPTLTSDLANAVKLAKAIDPNWELQYDEVVVQFVDPETGEKEYNPDGTPRMVTLRDYDFIKNMDLLRDRPFMGVVDANKNGFPTFTGDPWPYTRPSGRKPSSRRGVVSATVVEPERGAVEPEAAPVTTDGVDDNFGD